MQDKEYTLFSIDSTKANRRSLDEDNYHYHFADNPAEFEDYAIMHIEDYERLFYVSRNKANNKLKRLSVVKITYVDKDGHSHSIYRKFRPCYNEAFRGCVAISYHSILFLKEGDESILGEKVRIEKSCSRQYYRNHTNEVVLFSYRMSVLSIILGALSLAIAVISAFNLI